MPTRPPRGRLFQTPCSYARRSSCLYTLFDQDNDLVFFSFLSIKPAMLPTSMLGTTLRECLRCPLVLFIVSTCWETCFSSSHYSTFFFLLFLDQHTGHHARHDARILLWVHPWCLLIFSSSFRSIGSLLPIGHRSTSLCSAKTTNRLAAKLIYSFLLDWHACYSTCR
jgi:hypothetical protein